VTAPPRLAEALGQGAAALGVALAPDRVRLLLDYLALLERWNRSYNLTAVRDPQQMVPRHLLDCLAVAPLVRGQRLLDVGSGAGLPGLVLAVALPRLRVTLLDASLKRTRFLAHVVQELGLGQVRVLRCRVEQHAPLTGYDTVVSRAALALEALVQAAPALLAPGGRLVAMLGRAPQRDEVPVPSAWRLELRALEVPGVEGPRTAALLDAP